MIQNSLPRYDVTIAIGLRKRYTEVINDYHYVKQLCQEYVYFEKTCVTLTKTEFVYPGGSEPGLFIGLINYPRFPSTELVVFTLAERLATILMDKLDQERCSIMTPTEIHLYTNEKYMPEHWQYYYKDNKCTADHQTDSNCIRWPDERTGPQPDSREDDPYLRYQRFWRERRFIREKTNAQF